MPPFARTSRSKDEIFVECMFALAERYLEVTLSDL